MPRKEHGILSHNFKLEEFIYSQTAVRHGIDNSPSPEIVYNIERLVHRVLQPLRDLCKTPIIITSGYRCPELNRLIGGSPKSDHMAGLAADIRALKITPFRLAHILRDMCNNAREDVQAHPERDQSIYWPIKQVILEFNSWVHVSVMPDHMPPKYEVLTADMVDGKVRYTEGLEKFPV